MSEFKVGDRVKFVEPYLNAPVGAQGVVIETTEVSGVPHARVLTAKYGSVYPRSARLARLVPPFAVGDRVQVKGDPKSSGTVVEQHPGRENPRYTRVDLDGVGLGLFLHRELELMQSEPTPTGITLRAGDKIRNRITGREGYVYPAPIARMLKVYDARPPYRDGVPATAVEEYEFHHPGTYELVLRGQGQVF